MNTIKKGLLVLFLQMAFLAGYACTNFLVTKGASVEGTNMITYAADSHVLFGELYFRPAADYAPGTMVKVYEWDTGKYLGEIPQAQHTYSVVGNMNEHQLTIGETTYGGRKELRDTTGLIDYGSLIYMTLQRAKNAREAIKTIDYLMQTYGYYSSGESFSIADPNEVWIMELISKGMDEKGAVWVARRVPDGHICAHANQARIQKFPVKGKKVATSANIDDIFKPEVETAYAKDVITFARKKDFYTGKKDKNFDFSAAYAPVDFGGARYCDARAWAFFNMHAPKKMAKYEKYAMGHDLSKRMPLWIKPDNKLSLKDVMNGMRDHYEGTALDMTKDLGAGPYNNPYRWRPLEWEVDGKTYCNERAIATQQTGFSFVAQVRENLPDPVGGILWFGVDDASSTVYVPMYCGMLKAPETFAVGNGAMMKWSDNAAFWVFNQVTNYAYTRYNLIHPEIAMVQAELEDKFIKLTNAVDKAAAELYKADPKLAREYLTDFSVKQADNTVERWKELYQYLFMKYMDGNVKEYVPGEQNPKKKSPGYGDDWYKKIVEQTGDHFKVHGEGH